MIYSLGMIDLTNIISYPLSRLGGNVIIEKNREISIQPKKTSWARLICVSL